MRTILYTALNSTRCTITAVLWRNRRWDASHTTITVFAYGVVLLKKCAEHSKEMHWSFFKILLLSEQMLRCTRTILLYYGLFWKEISSSCEFSIYFDEGIFFNCFPNSWEKQRKNIAKNFNRNRYFDILATCSFFMDTSRIFIKLSFFSENIYYSDSKHTCNYRHINKI